MVLHCFSTFPILNLVNPVGLNWRKDFLHLECACHLLNSEVLEFLIPTNHAGTGNSPGGACEYLDRKSVGIHVGVNNFLKDSRGRRKSRRKALGNNEQVVCEASEIGKSASASSFHASNRILF